jgi:hypothetical protein
MSDIIERLREYHDNFDGRDTTLEDAIAEIDRLRGALIEITSLPAQKRGSVSYAMSAIATSALEGK